MLLVFQHYHATTCAVLNSALGAFPWPHSSPAGPKLDSVFLVFEYCPHDMGKLVDSLAKPFHESEVKCLMQQVGSA